MTIRPARVPDAAAICALVNHHAERGRMLHRSLESVYDALREFQVAETPDGQIVGCAAVDIFWADLAEVKSLAVAPERLGQGVGSRLLEAAIADALAMGVRKLFALTYEKEFFARHGFEVIDRGTLPEKVWRECLACPRADACDEIAMTLRLDDDRAGPAPGPAAGQEQQGASQDSPGDHDRY
jgi:amino-acid N-acetyltransferase